LGTVAALVRGAVRAVSVMVMRVLRKKRHFHLLARNFLFVNVRAFGACAAAR
jgi:hypothetical protein